MAFVWKTSNMLPRNLSLCKNENPNVKKIKYNKSENKSFITFDEVFQPVLLKPSHCRVLHCIVSIRLITNEARVKLTKKEICTRLKEIRLYKRLIRWKWSVWWHYTCAEFNHCLQKKSKHIHEKWQKNRHFFYWIDG